MLAPEKSPDGRKPVSLERPHEWVHFALGRRCAACGITLTKDDPDPSTDCTVSPARTQRKPRVPKA